MELSTIFSYAAYGLVGLVGSFAALKIIQSSIYTVPEKKEALVTRFGKYRGTPKLSGLHIKYPWPIDQVVARVPTYLQEFSDTLETKTVDDIFVSLPIIIQLFVNDTARFYFDNKNPVEQIQSIVNAAVRKSTAGQTFESLYTNRDEISVAVIEEIKDQMRDYGVTLKRIVIDEPRAPKHIQDAYNDVRASERKRITAANEADAQYIHATRKAEADRQRSLMIGEGVAGFRRQIADSYIQIRSLMVESGVDGKIADEFMMGAMRLDTYRDIGEKGNMVVVTEGSQSSGRDLASLISSLQALGIHPNYPPGDADKHLPRPSNR